MNSLSKQEYELSKELVPILEKEISKHKNLVIQYLAQEEEREYKAQALKAKEIIMAFRNDFNKLVKMAITTKYNSLDDYIKETKQNPYTLKKYLSFNFNGDELLKFIYEIGLHLDIKTTLNENSFFPHLKESVPTFRDSQSLFRRKIEEMLYAVIHKKHNGSEYFKTKYKFSKQELSSTIGFSFETEKDLFKILYFTGSIMEFTFRYEKAVFTGKQ